MNTLKYREKVIFESESLNEVLDFKKRFFSERSNFYLSCLEKVNALNKQRKTLLERSLLDTDEKYFEKLKEEHSMFIAEVETLGQKFFKDTFKGCYFFDVPGGLFGFELKDEKIGFIELGIIIRKTFPSEKDFEII